METITPVQEAEIKEAVLSRFDELSDSDRDALIIKIRADYEGIVKALIDSAKGLWAVKTFTAKDGTGRTTEDVYKEKPNTDVAMYLLNQLVGKPKETQVMEGRVNLIVNRG